jgi:hypothetical protein
MWHASMGPALSADHVGVGVFMLCTVWSSICCLAGVQRVGAHVRPHAESAVLYSTLGHGCCPVAQWSACYKQYCYRCHCIAHGVSGFQGTLQYLSQVQQSVSLSRHRSACSKVVCADISTGLLEGGFACGQTDRVGDLSDGSLDPSMDRP